MNLVRVRKMTFHIGTGDILMFLASLALVVTLTWLSIRFVSRSISRGGLPELEAAKRALEFEIARMKQRESFEGGSGAVGRAATLPCRSESQPPGSEATAG